MPGTRRRRFRLGDVVEVTTAGGLAYVQYSAHHPLMGKFVRVLPGSYETRPTDLDALVAGKERFFTFVHLGDVASQEESSFVGNLAVPEASQGTPLMKLVEDLPGGGVSSDWWLWDGEREFHVGTLTPEQELLSAREFLPYDVLVDYIASGWSPDEYVRMARPPQEGEVLDLAGMLASGELARLGGEADRRRCRAAPAMTRPAAAAPHRRLSCITCSLRTVLAPTRWRGPSGPPAGSPRFASRWRTRSPDRDGHAAGSPMTAIPATREELEDLAEACGAAYYDGRAAQVADDDEG